MFDDLIKSNMEWGDCSRQRLRECSIRKRSLTKCAHMEDKDWNYQEKSVADRLLCKCQGIQ